MAGSSPAGRRSYQWSSPQQSVLSDILYEDRNSEARHKLLLDAAKREHERVRAEAERVYRDHIQKEERQRLLEAEQKEVERIRLEEQIAAKRRSLQALQAKKVPIPPLPEPEPERVAPEAQPAAEKTPATQTAAAAAAKASPLSRPPTTIDGVAAQKSVPPPAPQPPAAANPFTSTKPNPFAPAGATPTPPAAQPSKLQQQPAGAPSPFARTQLAPQSNGAVTPQAAPTPPAQGQGSARQPDRYLVIHRNLKELRKSMDQQTATNRELKSRMGDMRREVRKTVGQLTTGAGANRPQINRLVKLFEEAMANPTNSQLVDPSPLVLEPREPVEGALHNEAQLPSLLLYLLNVFAKAAINQFINEGGAKPETADPVGIVVADVFSNPAFQWRGKPLIDILLAKYRLCCPVLFGYRGSEKTEQGRQRLGWKKEGGAWIGVQQHMDRMTGLGAGFAAISLRNFGKSKKKNPYPPSNYWTAMAKIVNTPGAEISNTQCVVLKAMIQHFEPKFLQAYGTAAVAALRVALIEFPTKAPEKSAAINSLQVLAQMLERDTGLKLC